MIYIDSDNALGSRFGDVDDGFAIAALLRSGLPVGAIGSVFGNTSEARAFHNNVRIAQLCGFRGRLLHGARRRSDGTESEVASWLAGTPAEVMALGPLTNVASALRSGARLSGVTVVGGNATSRGILPGVWPFEFNLTADRSATHAVFHSDVALTVVPLDVARRLRAGPVELEQLPGDLGACLRTHARRWLIRARLLGRGSRFPVWDLTAAMCRVAPDLFEVQSTTAEMETTTRLRFGRGNRRLDVVRDFDPRAVWQRFVALLHHDG